MTSSYPSSEFKSFLTRLRSRVGAGVLLPADAPGPESNEDRADPRGALRRAAVALVLREGREGAELLVIKRSEAEHDHWSGHLALPGGRVEPEDESLLATAARETFEEVGIDLGAGGEAIARLGTVNPQSPYAPRVSVTPFVFVAPEEYHPRAAGEPKELLLSEEVAAAFWVPVGELKRGGGPGRLPPAPPRGGGAAGGGPPP